MPVCSEATLAFGDAQADCQATNWRGTSAAGGESVALVVIRQLLLRSGGAVSAERLVRVPGEN